MGDWFWGEVLVRCEEIEGVVGGRVCTELEELFAVDCDHVAGGHPLSEVEWDEDGGSWRMRCG